MLMSLNKNLNNTFKGIWTGLRHRLKDVSFLMETKNGAGLK